MKMKNQSEAAHDVLYALYNKNRVCVSTTDDALIDINRRVHTQSTFRAIQPEWVEARQKANEKVCMVINPKCTIILHDPYQVGNCLCHIAARD